MTTAFAILFDLATELQADPRLARLTHHHDPDREAVRARLKKAILQDVMPGEGTLTRWQRLRIFCRNHVNRAQPAVPGAAVCEMLEAIEREHAADDDRIQRLASVQASELRGSRPQEFVDAVARITSSTTWPALGRQTCLDWLDQRWNHWAHQRVQDLAIEPLLRDLDLLSRHPETKIPGMGLPLAANFMADMGLSAFAKPDLHVLPIVSLLQLSVERRDEERHAFAGLIRIAQLEDQALRHKDAFAWIQEAGGLWPRFLDRVIYLIGSDNFKLDGTKNKQQAPQRRALMRQALLEAGLLDGRYA
jgi:hypothetical protein